MALTLLARGSRPGRCLVLLFLLALGTFSPAWAQTSALADELLKLSDGSVENENGTTEVVRGRLYGSTISFKVDNKQPGDGKFGEEDRVLLFSIARGQSHLRFEPDSGGATGKDFTEWATLNAPALLGYLFPTSMSESVSGRDGSQNFTQQFLLNTAFGIMSARQTATLRPETGALFEVENLAGDGRTGIAVQGLYRVEGAHFSVLGRYAQQRLPLEPSANSRANETRSFSIATDFHPSAVVSSALDWRVGIDARTGLLLSRADALSLGSLEYGGGIWTSARKDFSRVRIGFGSQFQGSKSYVPPSIAGDLKFLAEAINDRKIAWDLSLGAIGGVALTDRLSLNGKLVQTSPRDRAGEDRPSTRVMMGSLSYLVGGLTPVDVGYKVSNSAGMKTRSIFLQGYFGW